MTTSTNHLIPSTEIIHVPKASPALAKAVFVYGVGAYTVGVSGLVALILATLEILPFTGGPVSIDGTAGRIAFNLGLISLFGIQHAIMARPAFKRRWTQIIPAAAERSTFVALAGILMGAIVGLWQPLPEVLWAAGDGAPRYALLSLCAFGWAYLLAATFAIDHFELFGLRQVWRGLKGNSTPSPSFQARFMYRFDRHPIMTGVLIGLWSAPTLTVERLVLALGFTAYIIVGVTIEERDLRRLHGGAYQGYAKRVRTVIPLVGMLARR